MASARHSPRDREEIDLYKGVAGCEASARRCVGCLTWCLASAGWCVPCASSYGERHVDTTGCEDGGTGGDRTYLANIPPSTSWTYCRASQRGFPRRVSERKANRAPSKRTRSTHKVQHLAPSDPAPTSRRLALTPLWLALTPASTDATTTCPCADNNMALYSLFKITALCALFQAATAAVRRQPPRKLWCHIQLVAG